MRELPYIGINDGNAAVSALVPVAAKNCSSDSGRDVSVGIAQIFRHYLRVAGGAGNNYVQIWACPAGIQPFPDRTYVGLPEICIRAWPVPCQMGIHGLVKKIPRLEDFRDGFPYRSRHDPSLSEWK